MCTMYVMLQQFVDNSVLLAVNCLYSILSCGVVCSNITSILKLFVVIFVFLCVVSPSVQVYSVIVALTGLPIV